MNKNRDSVTLKKVNCKGHASVINNVISKRRCEVQERMKGNVANIEINLKKS